MLVQRRATGPAYTSQTATNLKGWLFLSMWCCLRSSESMVCDIGIASNNIVYHDIVLYPVWYALILDM